MPDLNQTNPFLSTYLIQNAIWWIETAQLSGLRVDTYSYSDKGFLKDWVDAIMKEYPNFNIVGEEWIYNPAVIAYWMKGQVNHDGYQSSLPSLMDFPLQGAMQSSFSPEGSLLPIYEALQMDFVYPNPHNLLTFMDNHDMDRFAGHIQEDLDTFKVALTLLMTTRGIPQFFYGTEILKNHERKGHHPSLRSDMPGGWPGDPSSVFTGVGLSEKERNSLSFVKQLLQWRKHEPLVHHGQLLHYKPQDGVYVYFRIIKDQARRLMVMLNPYEQSNLVPLKRFSQGLGSATKATHALSRTSFKWQDQIQLSPKSALILEIE
jgi:glycosidase